VLLEEQAIILLLLCIPKNPRSNMHLVAEIVWSRCWC